MSVLAILASVAVVAVQTIGGALWWHILRGRRANWVELLGMGIALGTIASALFALLLHNTALISIAWLLPTAIALVAWFSLRGRTPGDVGESRESRGEARAVLIGLVVGLIPLAVNWRRIPLGSVNDSSFLDIYFLQALSNGLGRFGAGESILMTGGSLRYHWFAYAWVGEVDAVAGLPPFAGLTRVLPLVALIGVSAVVARWASVLAIPGRFSAWTPTVAVALVVAGGYTGALYGSILNFDSPSQSFTTLWLLGLLFASVTYLRTGGLGMLLPIALLAAASTGGKVSHIAVAAGGMILLVGVGLVTRQTWWKRSLALTVVSGVFAVITYVVVIRGAAIDRNLVEDVAVKASTWQGLDPLPGAWGVLAGTIALILAALARLVGIGWLLRLRSWRTDPSMLLALGSLGVGLVALLALRDGINETWFLLAASAPASVLSAVGFVAALDFLRDRFGSGGLLRVGVVAVLVAIVALLLSVNTFSENVRPFAHWSAAWMPWLVAIIGAALVTIGTGKAHRAAAFTAAVVIALVASSVLTRPSVWWTAEREVNTETAQVVPDAFTPPQVDVVERGSASGFSRADLAVQLRDIANPQDIVFTTNPTTALVPAFSAQRMFLAGERYQFGLGAAGDAGELRDRQTIVSAVLTDPTMVWELLCPESVTWVWWEGEVPDALASDVVLSGRDASVIDLRPGCGAASTS